jgi:short-subunit dehydrogenase
MEIDEIKEQYETNFYGVIRCIKAAIKSMRDNESGRILGS